jgi:vacuolar-type H+-ATPase subunit I/STV1
METRDVQYMVAFKEHMSATNMQIEALKKEITSKNKRDMSSKAIELLSKDVKKYKEHCDILFKEREKLAEENKRLKERINFLELDNHNLKTLLMTSKIESKLLKEDLRDIKSEEYKQLGISSVLRERTGPIFKVNPYSTSIEATSSRSRDNISFRDSLALPSVSYHLQKDNGQNRSRSEYSRRSGKSRRTGEFPPVEKLRGIVEGVNPTKPHQVSSRRMVLKERINTSGMRLGKNQMTGGLNMSMNMPE